MYVHVDNAGVLKLREPSPVPLATDHKSHFKMYADIKLVEFLPLPRPANGTRVWGYLLALFSFCWRTQLVVGGMLWVSPRPTITLPYFPDTPACLRAGKNPTGFGWRNCCWRQPPLWSLCYVCTRVVRHISPIGGLLSSSVICQHQGIVSMNAVLT